MIIAGQEMVPRWVIRKSWIRTGARLEKRIPLIEERPKLQIISRSDKQNTFSNKFGVRKPQFTENEMIVMSNKGMDFSHWEFRFWAVGIAGIEAQICECRCCKNLCYSKEGRKSHLGIAGCTKKLIDAYKLLLLDNRCLICDSKTMNKSFGVPLCNKDACYNDFLHVESQPRALAEALNISARNNAV